MALTAITRLFARRKEVAKFSPGLTSDPTVAEALDALVVIFTKIG
jgi:hypothetical protein